MLSLINHTGKSVKTADFKKETKKILSYLEKISSQKFGRVTFALLKPEEITILNQRYLKKDKPTDVLTFVDYDDKKKYSGDIALCLDVIIDNAKKDKKNAEMYIADAVLHGLRHLSGFEHDYKNKSLNKIYKEQAAMLKEIKINWSAFNV